MIELYIGRWKFFEYHIPQSLSRGSIKAVSDTHLTAIISVLNHNSYNIGKCLRLTAALFKLLKVSLVACLADNAYAEKSRRLCGKMTYSAVVREIVH